MEKCTHCEEDADTGDTCIACGDSYCHTCIMTWYKKYKAIWMVCDANVCENCYLKQ